MRSRDDQPRSPESLRGESGLIQHVRRFLEDHFPQIRPHLVLGYSGGKDSLALLLTLRELERVEACKLTVLHVDHGLRPESVDDGRRAVEIGRLLGVEVHVRRADSPLSELYPGLGVEEAARVFRYSMYAGAVEEFGADAVAVAHHVRDQAETVLLHLIRGTGLDGMAGMASDVQLSVDGNRYVRVVRPLLHVAPEAIDALVEQSGVEVIEDPSNTSLEFRRNRVRHEVLPLVESIAVGATERLASFSELVRDDLDALEDVSHALMHGAMDRQHQLRWAAVQGAPIGLQRRVVRQWLRHVGYEGDLSRERVDAVVDMAVRNVGGKQVEIGGGWSVRFAQGHLAATRPSPAFAF